MTKISTLIILVVIIIVAGYLLVGRGGGDDISLDSGMDDSKAQIGGAIPFAQREVVKTTIKTDKGDIVLELYPTAAPKTATNFATLAINDFYDGITFHRVVPGFVIQGGDPLSKTLPAGDPKLGSGGPGFAFEDEINLKSLGAPQEYIDALVAQGYSYDENLQSLAMDTGVLAMANSGPNTNGSQFFITLSSDENIQNLNGKHTVFGKIIQGMDVVNSIAVGDKINDIIVEQ